MPRSGPPRCPRCASPPVSGCREGRPPAGRQLLTGTHSATQHTAATHTCPAACPPAAGKSAGCKAGGGGVGCSGPAVAAAGDTLKVLGLGRTNPLTTKDDPFKSAVKLQQVRGHIDIETPSQICPPLALCRWSWRCTALESWGSAGWAGGGASGCPPCVPLQCLPGRHAHPRRLLPAQLQLDVKLNTAAQCASTAGDNSILLAAWSTNSRICAAGTPTNGATPGACPVGACCRALGCGWACCCRLMAGRSLLCLLASLPSFTPS